MRVRKSCVPPTCLSSFHVRRGSRETSRAFNQSGWVVGHQMVMPVGTLQVPSPTKSSLNCIGEGCGLAVLALSHTLLKDGLARLRSIVSVCKVQTQCEVKDSGML